MPLEWLSVLAIGFFLGLKHAVEPDHAIAVTTIASQSRSLWRSSLAGIFWGVGHTFTLFVVGMTVILMKGEIPDKWAMSLEFLVGVMIVYLGVSSLVAFKKKVHAHEHPHNDSLHSHIHSHQHSSEHIHNHAKKSYFKSFLIGFIHGLAGSAAMVVLTMGTAKTVWQGGVYILVFGAGTIAGMLIFTTIIGIPFALSSKKLSVHVRLTKWTGMASIAFGLFYIYQVGFVDGLFGL